MKFSDRIQNSLTSQQTAFLDTFFFTCPDSFLSHMMLKTYPKNHILINTDDKCAHVYILLNGRLQAIEERTANTSYQFGEINAIEIIGDFELFSRQSGRMITLTTLEPSLCLVIPSTAYLQWIRQDANALFLRIQMLISQMSEQSLLERQFLFWDNRTRMLHYLLGECEKQKTTPPPYKIGDTRTELAGKLGCSVRTANRMIQELAKEGLASMVHGKMQVDSTQYLQLKEALRQTGET